MENTKKKMDEIVEMVKGVDEVIAAHDDGVTASQFDEVNIDSSRDLVHSGILLKREGYSSKNKGVTYYNYFVTFPMLGKEKRCTFVTAKRNIGKDAKGEKIYAREGDGYEMLDDMFNCGPVELCFEVKFRVNYVGEKEQIISPFAFVLEDDDFGTCYPIKTDTNADAAVLERIVSVLKRKGIIV